MIHTNLSVGVFSKSVQDENEMSREYKVSKNRMRIKLKRKTNDTAIEEVTKNNEIESVFRVKKFYLILD